MTFIIYFQKSLLNLISDQDDVLWERNNIIFHFIILKSDLFFLALSIGKPEYEHIVRSFRKK